MCEGTTTTPGVAMYVKDFHPDIQGLYLRDSFSVDDCIADEIKYLLDNGVATYGHSCCGHGWMPAHAHIFHVSYEKAESLGYELAVFYNNDNKPNLGIYLKSKSTSIPKEGD